ncbi:hypothetical protein PoB_002513200 [Plakobranchus ocellatus]|uniref:Uncharacterized protein n=1 Tax=Plakobranchus ocellatus TaxID=259542 RepID=A0AAV3ZU52_9GAST|nr:hypothetical protein PoB_002513200 [Plakobranchus ocellatus]
MLLKCPSPSSAGCHTLPWLIKDDCGSDLVKFIAKNRPKAEEWQTSRDNLLPLVSKSCADGTSGGRAEPTSASDWELESTGLSYRMPVCQAESTGRSTGGRGELLACTTDERTFQCYLVLPYRILIVQHLHQYGGFGFTVDS